MKENPTLINAECHIVASNRPDSFLTKSDEEILSIIWPNWDSRVCEFISLKIGPGNDPGRRLYEIKARDLIKMVLLWVLKHKESSEWQ